jgi:hypothetical protein
VHFALALGLAGFVLVLHVRKAEMGCYIITSFPGISAWRKPASHTISTL